MLGLLSNLLGRFLNEGLIELFNGLYIHHQRISVEVEHDQIILILDKGDEVDVRVNCVGFHINFKNAFDALKRLEVPHKVVLRQQSLESLQVLKVFQTFKFVVLDV